ncbi:hypothetical protein SKTS_10330 [Sulfurimicrobium lacus]|uniref:Uncharacterized protein n=1 Tax=Sulfurimicrobium lacus TaxID=2715678 RepID=A0A6F8VAK9_9PROT|nr:hypothetical protein SKTS_10330 [Sulfurimicrobium lacus]
MSKPIISDNGSLACRTVLIARTPAARANIGKTTNSVGDERASTWKENTTTSPIAIKDDTLTLIDSAIDAGREANAHTSFVVMVVDMVIAVTAVKKMLPSAAGMGSTTANSIPTKIM